ncbi:MAG: hypothetical protein P8X90_02360 [Desulfobacterales bacterium]|jgi:hypothetical protein
MKQSPKKVDRLDGCNALGLAILVLAALAAIIVVVDAEYRSNPADDQSARLVRVFRFDRLSLVPSGRSLRNPDMPKSAVEWRYDPDLAGIPPDSADLLIGQ